MNDRELDALVAEKVMGWERCPKEDCDGCDCPVFFYGRPLNEWCVNDPEHRLPWMPSTDIATAWQAVEKMKARPGHFSFRLEQSGTAYHLPEWAATFNNEFIGISAHAPSAICLAALKAVGVEVP